MNVDAVVSDKTKTTMLDLAGSPSFNYEAAAVFNDTANATRPSKNNTLRNINLSLEALGFAPGPTGLAADIANTALYTLQGKFGDAALSALAVTPIVGSIAAKKIKVERAIAAGEETVTFYRGVRVGDQPITAPKNLKYFDEQAGENIFVPGGFKGDRFDPMGNIADEAYENAFRKTKNLGEMGYPKSMDGMTGQSKLDTYVTTSPQQAIYYAMDQPLDIADALKSNNPLQILKIEIPVKELKRLEGIEAGMGLTGKGFKSNDYFLKKLHNIGTGRTTPRSLSSDKIVDGYIQGFAEVKPQLGFRNTTPGNDVSIFSLGIDPGYVTVLKGDNYNDLIKKFPEMKGHVLENLSIRNSLNKRKMSKNYSDYNYYEYTD